VAAESIAVGEVVLADFVGLVVGRSWLGMPGNITVTAVY